MSQITESAVKGAPKPMTPFQEFWHYFKRNKGAVVGLVYIVLMLVIALGAGVLAPHAPADQFRDALLKPPVWQEGGSWQYLLGTDDVGRDVLSRLMYGARLSLLVGCLVVVLSLIMGVVLGLLAGYFGGAVDAVIMRVVDIMLALPSLLLALVLVAVFGPSIVNASLALTFVALPHYVRLTRAAVLAEVNRDYVTASRVAGAGALRQMFVNILPNCLAPLIVQASRFLERHSGHGRSRLSGHGRATADAGVGHHALRRAAVRAKRLVGSDLPRPGDPADGAGI